MALQLNGTDGVTFNDGSEQWAAASPIGTKNLIINGDMRIAQRGTSVSGLQNSPSYLVDRWSYRRTATWSTASFTYSQISSTGLAYFDNASRLTVTGTETPSSNTFASLDQNIEGINIAHLAWGTSDAKTVTLSFWVRSSVTGTFSGSLFSTSSFVYEYTISSANTWEKKTITIDGPTTGTFSSDNTIGIVCHFNISGDTSGTYATSTLNTWQTGDYRYSTNQTNLAGTNGATFDVTGVQLEVGDTATPFEVMPYDMQLARCQRYYETIGKNGTGSLIVSGNTPSSQQVNTTFTYKVTKRATPAVTKVGTWNLINTATQPTVFNPDVDNVLLYITVNGYGYAQNTNNTMYLTIDAEL